MDRFGNSELKFLNMGRISENNIDKILGHRISERTIFCSDGHNSYKVFVNSYSIEHHVIIASKGERIKGIYHIQHINSLYSRIKSFFNIQKEFNKIYYSTQFTN